MNVLHYAASMDTNSEEFICDLVKICPIGVQDLTVGLDTPLHVAVKHANLVAFKDIHRSIRVSRQKVVIINWKNIYEGNTVLHLATETDQIRVVKLLTRVTPMDMLLGMWPMDVQAKNSAGRTALDIATQKQNQRSLEHSVSFRSGDMCNAGATPVMDAGNTMCNFSFLVVTLRVEWTVLNLAYSEKWPSDMKNALLVVATLIMTATCLAQPTGRNLVPGQRC